jgi:hypothetical protein
MDDMRDGLVPAGLLPEEQVKGLPEPTDLTPEEQALWDNGMMMELYDPTKQSGHQIVQLKATKPGAPADTVLMLIFGMEDAAQDAAPARSEGESMASFRYSPAQAEQFLFAEGWDKYHDRFMTRAYVQEGMDAFNKARHHK